MVYHYPLERGPSRCVEAVAFSPEGKLLATGSHDGTVKVWNVDEGRELMTLQGHTGVINALAFSPDGLRIAAASGDQAASIWNIQSRSPLTFLRGHNAAVLALAFSPDGKQLATGGGDRRLMFWESDTGNLIFAASRPSAVRSVAFTPDGKRLVAACSNDLYSRATPTLEVWDAQSYRALLRLDGHTDMIRSVAVDPNGRNIVSGARDNTIRIWEAFPWRVEDYRTFSGTTFLDKIGAYSALYWKERLRAQSSTKEFVPSNGQSGGIDPSEWPDRDAAATPAQIDLTRHYNGLLTVPWEPIREDHYIDSDLASLPRGLVKLENVFFDIRGLILLRSRGRVDYELESFKILPERIDGITVGQSFKKIHLLHGTIHAEQDGTAIARYTFNYTDKSEHTIDIVYGRDVRDWWEFEEDAKHETDRGKVVWRGTNPAIADRGRELRLYLSTFENPHPETPVETITFGSLLSQCGPFLIAMTVE